VGVTWGGQGPPPPPGGWTAGGTQAPFRRGGRAAPCLLLCNNFPGLAGGVIHMGGPPCLPSVRPSCRHGVQPPELAGASPYILRSYCFKQFVQGARCCDGPGRPRRALLSLSTPVLDAGRAEEGALSHHFV